MYIIGIDQGYASLGFSLTKVEDKKKKRIMGGTIKTTVDIPYPQRLKIIYDKLDYFFKLSKEEYKVDLVAMEMIVGRVSGIREVSGLIFILAAKYNIPVVEVSVGTVKKHIAGKGNAKKEDILKGLKRIKIDNYDYLGTDHENDSIAIAITAKERIKEGNKVRERDEYVKQVIYLKGDDGDAQ